MRTIATVGPVLALTLLPLHAAISGTHIGNIVLKTFDDSSPVVGLDPSITPRLGLRPCGSPTPILINGTVSAGVITFPIEDYGDICQAGLQLGSDLDLLVGGDTVATIDLVAVLGDLDEIPSTDLVGATLRVGTSTAQALARELDDENRGPTSSEIGVLEAGYSTVSLTLL